MARPPRKPDDLLHPRDYRIVLVAFLVALSCTFALPALPWTTTVMNQPLLDVIPTPVVLLMLTIPFLIYFGIQLNQGIKYNDHLRSFYREERAKSYGRVIFLSQMRPSAQGGTEWKIRNANGFAWTNARLMIEVRTPDGHETEKHSLGHIAGSQEIRIQSQLSQKDHAQWRVMIVTDQGRLIDFPDSWLEASVANSRMEAVSSGDAAAQEPALV